MWNSQVLTRLRVVGREDSHLRIHLIRNPIPFMLRIVVDLEHFVSHVGEYFVNNVKVVFTVDALRVTVCHWEIATWAFQRLPDTVISELAEVLMLDARPT
jgi:hypothetical protein